MNLNATDRELAKINVETIRQHIGQTLMSVCYSRMFENQVKCKQLFINGHKIDICVCVCICIYIHIYNF